MGAKATNGRVIGQRDKTEWFHSKTLVNIIKFQNLNLHFNFNIVSE